MAARVRLCRRTVCCSPITTVGEDCIQRLSAAEHDYMANGFSASTRSEEQTCPDLEVDVLLRTSEVTATVGYGIQPETPAVEANRMRKASIARIERDCAASTNNRRDVVTLYSGGRYSLYEYKKYTDVRLVFAPELVKNSMDGMIQLALLFDGPARKYRKEFDDRVQTVIASSESKIAQAHFSVYGSNEYLDATLPGRWIRVKPALDLNTPFDFVTTADTHGGNSGSPPLTKRGELVGILFDGNWKGLENRYLYTEQQACSVHITSNAILEALQKVYKADWLLRELGASYP